MVNVLSGMKAKIGFVDPEIVLSVIAIVFLLQEKRMDSSYLLFVKIKTGNTRDISEILQGRTNYSDVARCKNSFKGIKNKQQNY